MVTGQRKHEQERMLQIPDGNLGLPRSNNDSTPEEIHMSFEKIDRSCPLLEIERNEISTRNKIISAGDCPVNAFLYEN